mmetsp:Transcript_7093/g.7197  ORF Transcript_7093/g.7197 Transcript_7093/m.7197 type:complete len:92 (-) Transcript_7093:1563-1838(-)
MVGSIVVDNALKDKNIPSLRASKLRSFLLAGSMVGSFASNKRMKYLFRFFDTAKSYGLCECPSLIPAEAGKRRRKRRKQFDWYDNSEVSDL